jgi:hypothetical protein
LNQQTPTIYVIGGPNGASLQNFFRLYLPLADQALLFNGAGHPPLLVAEFLLHLFRTINSIGHISNERSTETLAHSDGRGPGEGGLDYPPTALYSPLGKKSEPHH